MEPTPLASGRDADVFALEDRRVLRRYRNGGDVAPEAAVMRHVAALGFPVPTVYEAHGADLVMERVDGPTIVSALISEDFDARAAGAVLAELHDQLHELPPRVSTDPDARILHLDLHPENVLLSSRGPLVIDWRNSAEGPPDLDVAVSALILALVSIDEAHPFFTEANILLRTFLRSVGGNPVPMLDRAVRMRRVDPALTELEVARLPAAARLVKATAERDGRD